MWMYVGAPLRQASSRSFLLVSCTRRSPRTDTRLAKEMLRLCLQFVPLQALPAMKPDRLRIAAGSFRSDAFWNWSLQSHYLQLDVRRAGPRAEGTPPNGSLHHTSVQLHHTLAASAKAAAAGLSNLISNSWQGCCVFMEIVMPLALQLRMKLVKSWLCKPFQQWRSRHNSSLSLCSSWSTQVAFHIEVATPMEMTACFQFTGLPAAGFGLPGTMHAPHSD